MFGKWVRSAEVAFFFLDSVDEAKFHKPSDFYTALDRFVAGIGSDGLARATTLISSRVSEWQPQSDAAEVTGRLRVQPRVSFRLPKRILSYQRLRASLRKKPNSNGTPISSRSDEAFDLLVVQLQPLNREQVKTFIQSFGITDSEKFINALDSSYAWDFVRRPVDVVDLANFWLDRGRLGSLSEIIKHDVETKLRAPKRDQADPLSVNQSLTGAEALAASTTFCRQFNFKVPDDSFVVTDAIDARGVLPATWRVQEVSALLRRPIFDSASYGRIRFHHRRITEYLTAAWLSSRMHAGCPVNELDELLFERVGNRRVLRPSMAPVAAWLCCGEEPWNEDVGTGYFIHCPQFTFSSVIQRACRSNIDEAF